VHYTRFGAGLAGTALARGVAQLLGVALPPTDAPGDRTVALVPTPSAQGYWLVQCDGNVFAFGDAPVIAKLDPPPGSWFVAAVGAGPGLWLVARNGAVAAAGKASPPEPSPRRTEVVAAARVGAGIVQVSAADDRRAIDVSAAGDGWQIARSDGTVTGASGARTLTGATPTRPIAAYAATPNGNGGWLVGRNGSVTARGDAEVYGDAIPEPLPPEVARLLKPSEQPAVEAIVAASDAAGYWIVRANGKVVALGSAKAFGDTANFALFTH
jgi:hypothetical protein